MKKLFRSYRLPMLSALSVSLLLLGCTNADYDFDKVDYTLGFGSGEVVLPSNNSINITLDDILDLGNSDLISTTSNGDYVLGKDPASVSPVNVKVDPIEDAGRTSDIPIEDITLDPIISEFAGQVIILSDKGIEPIKINQDISSFDYSFTIPDEVKELDEITLEGNGSELEIKLSLPYVTELQKLIIKLPEQLILENIGIGTLAADTTLTLPAEYALNNYEVELKFLVKRIKAKLDNDHKFKLDGTVYVYAEVNKILVPDAQKLLFSGHVTLGKLKVQAATGVFMPSINAQRVGSTTINSLPDFLTDARVVADIYNPQIWLDIESNLPLGGTVEAKLGSSTLNGFVELSKAKGNALFIGGNTTTKIVVCRKAPAELTGYTAVIADDLSDIVKKLSEGMQITIDITKFEAEESKTTIQLGHDYTFKPNYKFTAPLALGDNAVIIYNDTEGDWNEDIKDIQLSNGSKAILTANVENGVPADLEIDVEPLDENGQILAALVVKPIKNRVAAGSTTSEIQYEITDANGTGLKQLDGVDYRLKVTAPSDAAQRGKTLNKNHKIYLKDIKVQLNGKVVYDAN